MIDDNREKCIVSADDFGLSGRDNENILQLVRLGKLDRISVMPDGILPEDQIAELAESGVAIDLHLALGTHKEWIEKRSRKRSYMVRVCQFLAGYLTRRRGKLQVFAEWNSQIQKFKKLFGRFPDGLNSHEHLHFFPPYFRIALRLARKYNLVYFRFGRRGGRVKGSLVSFVVNYLRILNHANFAKSKLASSDYFVSFDWLKDASVIPEFLPDEMKTEIVFHPEREKEYEFILKNL